MGSGLHCLRATGLAKVGLSPLCARIKLTFSEELTQEGSCFMFACAVVHAVIAAYDAAVKKKKCVHVNYYEIYILSDNCCVRVRRYKL